MTPNRFAKLLIRGLLALNTTVAIVAVGVAMLLWFSIPGFAVAAPLAQSGGIAQEVSLGAALAIGLAAIGAGIAVGISGAAAIGAMAEKPEILGRALIVVGLAEGIAIYGLIISFMILTR